MNVLFIDPVTNFGHVDEGEGRNKLDSPSMGLIYIATIIKKRYGANVKIIDHQNFDFEQLTELLQSFKPTLVGITSKTFNILGAFGVAKTIKQSNGNIVIVVGGAHPTALPEQTLIDCPHIDACILREGENPFEQIYLRIRKKVPPTELFIDIPGVVFRQNDGSIKNNGEGELIKDLDSLPFPDMSLVDYSKYARVYTPSKHKLEHVYPVFGSRGCPFDCSFCMPLLGRRHRMRSVDGIIEELIGLHRNHGASRVYFEDSLFSSNSKRFEEFCEKYKSNGLDKKILWGFETRIDTITFEELKMAKESGCIYTFFGVESGSEHVLKKNNKKYTRDSIISKVYSAKRAGIDEVNISIIFGLPYENSRTIQETLSLLEILPCDNAGINILDIYPNTRVAEMVSKGEGGLRSLNNNSQTKYQNYSRRSVMVEVNDLSSSDILAATRKAQEIMARKKSKRSISYLRKLYAYSIEFLKEDPRQFMRYSKEVLTGRR